VIDRIGRVRSADSSARFRRGNGEAAQRWRSPQERYQRGYAWLFAQQCTQAHEGCDFKFLHAGKATAEPDIY